MTPSSLTPLGPRPRSAGRRGARRPRRRARIDRHQPRNASPAERRDGPSGGGGGAGKGRAAGDDRGHRRAHQIGLSGAELDWLGTASDVLKLSRANLPFAVADRRHGATTVAATMICAHLAGVRVFATGGIGGVHRGVDATMDISADLDELARTPVAVVCAGAKAILDLPRTLEYLETRGVPVVGYRTDHFPAFWSRKSELAVPIRLDTPEAITKPLSGQGLARIERLVGSHVQSRAQSRRTQGGRGGAPHWIRAREAAGQGITGSAVTPFLLSQSRRDDGRPQPYHEYPARQKQRGIGGTNRGGFGPPDELGERS